MREPVASKNLVMQFMGFHSGVKTRNYRFTVREGAEEPREFTIAITQECFNSRRLRFQDAPDVCSIRLRTELAAHENHPPQSHFVISDAEIEDYRTDHTPTRRSAFHRPLTGKY
jgi:hypothetical protein